MAKSTEVAKKEQSTAVAAQADDLSAMFMAEAGAGLENIGREDTKIPFLRILQSLSPEVDEGNTARFMEGARAGMILNTVTRELYDGKEGVILIPVHFEKKYIRWRKRSNNGGGFIQEYDVRAEAEAEFDSEVEDLVDTANHFVLAQTGDGGFTPAVLSCTSTKLGASRSWNAMMQSVQMQDAQGNKFTPPSFACLYNMTTVRQQNDKGTFYNIAFERVGVVQQRALYEMAKEFRNTLTQGVKLNYNEEEPVSGSTIVGDVGDLPSF